MEDSSSIGFIVIAILLLLSAFLSSSEIAILSSNKIRLKHLAESGSRRAKIVMDLLKEPANFFSLIQIGNTSFTMIIASIATVITINLWGKKYVDVAILLATLLVLMFGEIIPKGIASKKADTLSLLSAPIIKMLIIIFYPVIFLISMCANFLIVLFGGKTSSTEPLVTEDELKMLVKVGEKEGVLEEEQEEMIRSIFDFKDTLVREVMVPRIDMVCIEANEKLENAIDIILKEGHSRIPVYEEKIDKIIGILYAKDILKYVREKCLDINLKEILRSPYFIPETKRVDELFKELRKNKIHIAIVVDEHGGTAGLITIEDLLEEIVGEIQDEYDDEEELFKKIDENTAEVSARINLEELNEKFSINLTEDEVDTLGGFIFHNLGRIPQKGKKIEIENVEIEVLNVIGQKIDKVRIKKK